MSGRRGGKVKWFLTLASKNAEKIGLEEFHSDFYDWRISFGWTSKLWETDLISEKEEKGPSHDATTKKKLGKLVEFSRFSANLKLFHLKKNYDKIFKNHEKNI